MARPKGKKDGKSRRKVLPPLWQENPLARGEKENETAYKAFLQFKAMPADERTITAFVKSGGCTEGQGTRWGSRHLWRLRAALLDQKDAEAITAETRMAVARSAATQAQKHAERRLSVEDEAWELSWELVRVAKKMLQWPLSEQTVSKDGRTTVIKPAKWTMTNLPNIISVAGQLWGASMGSHQGTGASPEVIQTFLQEVASVIEDLVPLDKRGEAQQRLMEAAERITLADLGSMHATARRPGSTEKAG